MKRPPPRSTRTDTLFPYTTLFRSIESAVAIPDNFSFKTELEADFSLVSQTGDLSSISVTAPARINFYALGSESGLENTFLFGALSHTEADYAYDPTRLIGSADFTSDRKSTRLNSSH